MERDHAERRREEARRAAAERVERAREDTRRLVDSLARLWDGVVEATDGSNIDDEHDPEGATVAYERAQLRDMLRQARADQEGLDRAVHRLSSGEYWLCERCGGPIAPARLAARPTATTCITCANAPRR